MLNFLEEKQEYKPRNTFRAKPQIAFGISLDTPLTFRNQHCMISPTSYAKYSSDIDQNDTKQIFQYSQHPALGSLVHKTDINQVQEGKVIGSGELTSRPDRYHESYRLELQKDSSRFKLTRGQFTNFIEKVRVTNQVFGPMSGEERSVQKSLQTKRSIIQNSHLHLQKSKEKLQLQKSLRKESSRILQKLIDEKRVLRQKRDKFYGYYRKELTDRKSPRHDYTLPKILVNRDLKPHNKHLDFGIFRTLDNSMLSNYIK